MSYLPAIFYTAPLYTGVQSSLSIITGTGEVTAITPGLALTVERAAVHTEFYKKQL